MIDVKANIRLGSTDDPIGIVRTSKPIARSTLKRAGEFAVAEARANLTAATGEVGLSAPPGYMAQRRPGFPHEYTGNTYDSITYEIVERGNQYPYLRITAGGAAKWLNWGRRPNAVATGNAKGPLPRALMAWARKKGLPRRGGKIRTRAEFVKFVALQIGREGQAPTYFFSDAIASMRRALREQRLGTTRVMRVRKRR